jgi:heat shock protein HslJ
MKKILVPCLLVGLLVFGCKKDSPKEAPSFLETEWTLVSIQNVSTKVTINFPADAEKKITLIFSGGSVIFNGICNTGSGNFETIPFDATLGTLTVTDLGATKVNCTYSEWEGYVIQSLGKSYKYLITGNSITITTTGDYNLTLTQL